MVENLFAETPFLKSSLMSLFVSFTRSWGIRKHFEISEYDDLQFNTRLRRCDHYYVTPYSSAARAQLINF
jgi:hypothetical protein